MTDTQRDKVLLTLVDKLNENIEFTKNINQKLDEISNDIKNIYSILNKHDDQIYLNQINFII